MVFVPGERLRNGSNGWITVNDKVVSLENSLFPMDVDVQISQVAIKKQSHCVTIALNKPVGWVSSQPEPGEIPAIKLLETNNIFRTFPNQSKPPQQLDKLVVVGRLDKDSRGLLLFTQDGRIAKQLVTDHIVEKEYLVRVQGRITPPVINRLRTGMQLDGKSLSFYSTLADRLLIVLLGVELKPAIVNMVRENVLQFILTEGRNRTNKEDVSKSRIDSGRFQRIRIGPIESGDLPEGKWKYLPNELFDTFKKQ